MKTLDVGSLLDSTAWSGYQRFLVAATALTIVLDGFDNQLMAIAILPLMREWGVERAAFASVLASGMIGMMVGGALGGIIGDRIGRRGALLASVGSFGALTALTPLVHDVFTLGLLRFLVGLGLGGAMPNCAALVSEYVPARRRPFAVTLTIVCIPLGGTLAGVVGAQILPRFGWQALFFAGGIAPLILAIVLWRTLPESPRYLARHRNRWPELIHLLRRLGHDVDPDAMFVDAGEKVVTRVSPRELLSPALRRDTVALSASFFFCLLSVYVVVNWVPSLLASAGFDEGVASNGLASFNLGGVAGALLGAALISRAGSRHAMLAMSAAAVVGATVLAAIPLETRSAFGVLALLAWTGASINGVQVTMYALAAHVYPTGIRATGVGTAVAIGRVGGVLSPYVGSWALETGGGSQLFALIVVTMTVVFAALAGVRGHIPRSLPVRASHASTA